MSNVCIHENIEPYTDHVLGDYRGNAYFCCRLIYCHDCKSIATQCGDAWILAEDQLVAEMEALQISEMKQL